MGENLFEGLPPPQQQQQNQSPNTDTRIERKSSSAPAPAPAPIPIPVPKPALKSALKRSKPAEAITEQENKQNPTPAPERRLRFKTTTDASEKQVIEAMQKIALHIKNPAKFSKASKLAIQLIEAGSVKPGTSDYFFDILDVAMSSPSSCTEPSVRADYHALFTAVQDVADCLDKKQKNSLTAWTTRAVMANDLFTDDSFVFSKTAGRLKESISDLPVSTEDDDIKEAEALKDEAEMSNNHNERKEDTHETASSEESNKDESDPFGLDALIPSTIKKDDKSKGKKDVVAKTRKEGDEEETKRFLKLQREALITCLEIAARRYKTPWCQTVLDILVKHAYDNVSRFTSRQRTAIEKLWVSIREQHNRRKQGKSVNGKLDMTAFEFLQQKYSTEEISIRRAVGGSGDRRAQQWLG